MIRPSSKGIENEKRSATTKLDRDSTIKHMVTSILNNFPTMSENKTSFLVNNRKYIQFLMGVDDISGELNRHVLTQCPSCPDSNLLEWPYPAKKSSLLSMGAFNEIKIHLKTCPTCHTGYYPDLYSKGLVPLHNKFLLSYDLLLDLYNLTLTGSSLVDNIEEKYLLLGMCNGYEEDELKINLSNNSKMIEKLVIATSSALSKYTET